MCISTTIFAQKKYIPSDLELSLEEEEAVEAVMEYIVESNGIGEIKDPKNELQLERAITHKDGSINLRFNQIHKGLRVYGGRVFCKLYNNNVTNNK